MLESGAALTRVRQATAARAGQRWGGNVDAVPAPKRDFPGRARQWTVLAFGLCCLLLGTACSRATTIVGLLGRTTQQWFDTPRPVPTKLEDPYLPDAKLAALWVGHATVLLQLGDKFVLTDPVFTTTVGQLSKRLVEPGLKPEAVPKLSAVLISHMHFDHLSLGSLDLIESKMGALVLPKGGSVYVPHSRPLPIELATWQSVELDGLRITAVPVGHSGWRYGGDQAWMKTSYTGYIIQYAGVTVYFGGDTSMVPAAFAETRRRFQPIDLALLPIAPITPRDFMCRAHLDPADALVALRQLGATSMLPIHYDTFSNSFDNFGQAGRELQAAMRRQRIAPQRVLGWHHGQRRVLAWDNPNAQRPDATHSPTR